LTRSCQNQDALPASLTIFASRSGDEKDRLRPLYNLVGCNPNRETLAAIEASALRVESVRHGEVPKAPRVERPMIIGTARR
jgi:hypothetical protein